MSSSADVMRKKLNPIISPPNSLPVPPSAAASAGVRTSVNRNPTSAGSRFARIFAATPSPSAVTWFVPANHRIAVRSPKRFAHIF